MTLEIRSLSKIYGRSAALRSVSFTVESSETLAVLGQNGAGKSTLVKILAGVTPASSGVVSLDGQPMAFATPREALRAGITLIPQELAYAPALSAAENMLIGSWGGGKAHLISQRALARRARAISDSLEIGLDVDLRTPMSELSLAQCQLVEIAKALRRRARVVLLDEPTAALSTTEAERLFAALERLRVHQVITLYISHRLDEVLGHTDRAVVLRDGELVSDLPTAEHSRDSLIEAMVGGDSPDRARLLHRVPPPPNRATGVEDPAVVEFAGLADRRGYLTDVSLQIRKGEVVGLFGLRGSGYEAAVQALTGLRPHHGGTLTINGNAHRPIRSPRQARRAGVAVIPGDRKGRGLALAQSLRFNLIAPQLAHFASFGFMRRRREEEYFARTVAQLNLKYASWTQPVRELSGGNQQKLMVASRISIRCPILIAEEPTRGVDVRARAEIHEMLTAAAANGAAVLLATSDLDEVVSLSTRLLVFRSGRVVESLTDEEKTAANALRAASQPDGIGLG